MKERFSAARCCCGDAPTPVCMSVQRLVEEKEGPQPGGSDEVTGDLHVNCDGVLNPPSPWCGLIRNDGKQVNDNNLVEWSDMYVTVPVNEPQGNFFLSFRFWDAVTGIQNVIRFQPGPTTAVAWPITFQIRGRAIDDAPKLFPDYPTYATHKANLGTTMTGNSVTFAPTLQEYSDHVFGAIPLSFPNLSTIANEIIARPGWSSGNRMGFHIMYDHANSSQGVGVRNEWVFDKHDITYV